MTKIRLFSLSLGAALLAAALPAQAESITFTTEDWEPLQYAGEGGKVIGSAADVVHELMRRLGWTYSIEMMPWTRAYETATSQPGTCVFSTTITDERKPLFKWVGPIGGNTWTFYKNEGSPIELASLEDARPLRIGTYLGDVRESFLKEKGFQVQSAPDDSLNAKKLEAGRIDLWFSDTIGVGYMLKKSGAKIQPVLTVRESELAIACHKDMDDSLIARMQAGLDAMKADGTYDTIRKQYIALP